MGERLCLQQLKKEKKKKRIFCERWSLSLPTQILQFYAFIAKGPELRPAAVLPLSLVAAVLGADCLGASQQPR